MQDLQYVCCAACCAASVSDVTELARRVVDEDVNLFKFSHSQSKTIGCQCTAPVMATDLVLLVGIKSALYKRNTDGCSPSDSTVLNISSK